MDIKRGCRQGDPIASYIFILCIEYLAIRLRENNNIKGININNTEYKLSQFADDTTLILDGSEYSLNEALAELSFFGSFSGLNINVDKTQVIWIGSKKYSDITLCPDTTLVWGKTTFSLLGIEYNVDLHEMVKLNYDKKLVKIKSIITIWNRKILTPLGRNCIFKSLLISQFNHLFISLPNPSESFLNKLVNVMHTFIWGCNTIKIKNTVCIQDYESGGLKVLDLKSHITSLKTTWIRRYLTSINGKWKNMLETICNTSILFSTGGQYINSCCERITNKFWHDTFNAWKTINDLSYVNNAHKCNIVYEPLFYNNLFKIDSKSYFMPDFFESGIYYPAHLIDNNGKFYSFNAFIEKHPNIACNFITYYSILESIRSNSLWKESLELYTKTMCCFPLLTPSCAIFYKNTTELET